jgi:photosystem II stability/assembly factor-like uncharacterized protein
MTWHLSRWAIGISLSLGAFLAPAASSQTLPAGELHRHTHIHGLAVDRADPTALLIATHHGLFRAAADGQATLISPVQDFMGFTAHPSDPARLFASGHPAAGGNLGFIASADGGNNWVQVSPGLGGPVDFHQMDVSPADPQTVYGNHHGLQVSRDGGKSWTLAGPAPEGLIALSASAAAADRLYAATKSGLKRSDDAGATWQAMAFDGAAVTMVEARAGGTLFAFVAGRGLMTSSESDPATWHVLGNGLGDRALLYLAANPGDPGRLYAVTDDSRVIASVDGGLSWAFFGER